MLRQATYERGAHRLTVSVERIDTWVASSDEVVNFPGVVELADGRLVLRVQRGQHGVRNPKERVEALVSSDGGARWVAAPSDLDVAQRDPEGGPWTIPASTGGILGYFRDGTVGYINGFPKESAGWRNSGLDGPYHLNWRLEDPTFRFRRFTGEGKLLEAFDFKIAHLPWSKASYENYGHILELPGGDLLAAFCAIVEPPRERPGGRRWRFSASDFIARSADGGRRWEFVHAFHEADVKPVYGAGDREVDEGFDEPDVEVLPNGDLYCIMRTGSYSPMYGARSTDGGQTWSTPVSTGWQGVKPALRVLPNGVLACTAGRGGYGQPQITHAMFSLDGTGEHWETPFAFHTGPGCSYTTNLERDGKLHVIYSHSDFTRSMGAHGLPVQAIKRAVIDVQKETR